MKFSPNFDAVGILTNLISNKTEKLDSKVGCKFSLFLSQGISNLVFWRLRFELNERELAQNYVKEFKQRAP